MLSLCISRIKVSGAIEKRLIFDAQKQQTGCSFLFVFHNLFQKEKVWWKGGRKLNFLLNMILKSSFWLTIGFFFKTTDGWCRFNGIAGGSMIKTVRWGFMIFNTFKYLIALFVGFIDNLKRIKFKCLLMTVLYCERKHL